MICKVFLAPFVSLIVSLMSTASAGAQQYPCDPTDRFCVPLPPPSDPDTLQPPFGQ